MIIALYIIFLVFLLGVVFWLVSMIVSSLTKAPYVPTAENAYAKALELANPQKGEILFDLGCGDSRILRYAVKKYRITGFGYEISPYCVWMSLLKNKYYGVSKSITIYRKSLKEADYQKADIIYMYLTNAILDLIEDDLFDKIKPTCRVVTVAFKFKHHQPAKAVTVRQLGRTTKAYLYSKD